MLNSSILTSAAFLVLGISFPSKSCNLYAPRLTIVKTRYERSQLAKSFFCSPDGLLVLQLHNTKSILVNCK